MSQSARVEEIDSDSDPEEVAPTLTSGSESILNPGAIPSSMRAPPDLQRDIPKHFQCLYPIYFDRSRSHAEGRKVSAELAVENPLARDILDAVRVLGLNAGLEPEKLHPKDWANPGRVRVLLKDETGRPANPKIKNSTCTLHLPPTQIYLPCFTIF